MKKILARIIIGLFRKFYFVSGTFEHEGERKWFRIIYTPNSGYVNEDEVKAVLYDKTNYLSKYVVVTHFHKVSYKQYLNF